MSGWQWGEAQTEHNKEQICNRCGEQGHWGPECEQDWCSRCKTTDHTEDTCPILNPIKCAYCGEIGHTESECEKKRIAEALCPICGRKGHDEDECPTLKSRCQRCGDRGHSTSECTVKYCDTCKTIGHKRWCALLWKDYECRRCGRLGHHERRCNSHWAIGSCANCGQEGHWAVDCLAIRKGDEPQVQTRAMIAKRRMLKSKMAVIKSMKEKMKDLQKKNYIKLQKKMKKKMKMGNKEGNGGRNKLNGRGRPRVCPRVNRMGRLVAVQQVDSYGPSPVNDVKKAPPTKLVRKKRMINGIDVDDERMVDKHTKYNPSPMVRMLGREKLEEEKKSMWREFVEYGPSM